MAKDDGAPDRGPIGAGPAQELVVFGRDLDADYPHDHPEAVRAAEAARHDVEEALKDRRRQLAGERKLKAGAIRAVVGDPRWEHARRVTVQGHLEVAGEHGAADADAE